MASDQVFITNDLRSGAKEFNRDKDHRVKWARGVAFGPGRRIDDAHPRPVRLSRPRYLEPGSNPTAKARSAVKLVVADASGESSADDADTDVDAPSTTPVPDADITYSFDAARGPSPGNQILSLALLKAIERFEVREMDRLIKNEYEVLGSDGEAVEAKAKHKAGTKAGAAAAPSTPLDEAEYEFV